MPINWESFKQNLLQDFSILPNGTFRYNSHREAAAFITQQYDIHMMTGGDTVSKNFILTGNTVAMEDFLVRMFDMGMEATIRYDAFLYITQAVISYWTGATLSIGLPPPGAISSVSNVVLNPGVSIPGRYLDLQEESYEYWINELISVLKIHLSTVAGQVVGMFPAPPGVPVPIPVPWIGYQ